MVSDGMKTSSTHWMMNRNSPVRSLSSACKLSWLNARPVMMQKMASRM